MLVRMTEDGRKPVLLVELDEEDVQFIMQSMAASGERQPLWRKMVKARMELGLLQTLLPISWGGNRS